MYGSELQQRSRRGFVSCSSTNEEGKRSEYVNYKLVYSVCLGTLLIRRVTESMRVYSKGAGML